MSNLPRYSPTRGDLLAVIILVLAAFMLRVVVVFDRAAADRAFSPLPMGSDQRTYVAQAELYEVGQWPSEPFRYQPGLAYYFIGIRALVGKSLGVMRLATSLTGALTCGLMVGIGWLLTRRRWGGYLAGFLLAIYPVAIFYSTELLIPGLASFYVALFLFLALWQRERLTWWRSSAIGLTLGLLTITRSNQTVLVATWILLLAFTAGSWRRFGLHAAIFVFFFGLVIAPVAIWNRQHGSNQLITNVGAEEVYRGNNRDASGLNDRSLLADVLVDKQDYTGALLRDIFRNPRRFIDLQIRKTGLYWGASEPANNISYQDSGEAVSPLLRSIPLDFGILAFFGWLGTIALFRHDRRAGIFFIAMHLLMFIGVMATWTEGRLKQPAVIPLVVLSIYGIVCLLDWIRATRIFPVVKIDRPTRQVRVWSGIVIALLVIGGWLHWAVDNLPTNRPLAALPAGIYRMDVVFDDTLRLVGWRPLADWPAGERGWLHYFAGTYAVELFWDVLQPTSIDYNMYLAYVDEGVRYAGVDRPIGTVSHPGAPTSTWQPGNVYSEILGFRLTQDIPRERSGDIRLGVYRVEGVDDTRQLFTMTATSLPNTPDSIVLQKLAIYDLGHPSASDNDLLAANADFGGKIVLRGYRLPETIEAGKPVTLALEWTALAEMSQDYVMLGHIENEQETVIANFDTSPRANTLVTSTWPPDYPVQDHVTFNLPEQPGIYSIYIGWYDPVTGERLSAGTPDNRLLLGKVTVVRP